MLRSNEASNAPRPQRPVRDILLLCGIIGIGLMSRTLLMAGRGQIIDFDENFYFLLARNLFAGKGYTRGFLPEIMLPPLYPILVGMTSLLLRSIVWAGRAVSILAGALTCIPLYLLLRELKNRRIALTGALFLALFPAVQDFIPHSYAYRDFLYTGAEPLALLFLISGVAMIVLSVKRGKKLFAIASGAAFGLSYLAFPVGIIYGLVYVFAILALGAIAFPKSFKHRLLCATLCALAMLAVASPYLLYLRKQTGMWTLSGKLQTSEARIRAADKIFEDNDWSLMLQDTFALSPDNAHLESPSWGISDYHRQKYLRGEPQWTPTLSRILTNFRNSLISLLWCLCPWYLWPFLACGIVSAATNCLRGRSQFENEILLLALLAPNIGIVLRFLVFPRYMLPLCFVVVSYTAEATTIIGERLKSFGGLPRRAPILLLCILMGLHSLWPVLRPNNCTLSFLAYAVELGKAAEALSENTEEATSIMSIHPQAVFRANRDWRTMPIAQAQRVFDYALNTEADALLFEPNHPVVNYTYPLSDAGFRWVLFDLRAVKHRGLSADQLLFEPQTHIISTRDSKPTKFILHVKAKPISSLP